ncbi:UDP-3-O-(3-hydroxymyristoyl)glucosamine N-acyltransferase [Flagellimonas pacifica]|uniref:UDP-3-O-[3-hydroxymyristoyl] glucosamine N-acyltransferase n=1 Tax=Flagellimonas pacifica TaxID=1247520 RepID=A0A285MT47_9FLAO|nr:UDP-3-O-(3-hydroxymyristoyl)glucosamine N-acyltransferase [Allomuricauda parva]SNY99853.1 UDP-3-O-[3-hydroxymyristoyl] glucosamine N-acyltransferase [Allomuricauda parva]
MKFPKSYSLKEISEIIGSEFIGDANFPVLGMNEIHVVEKGDIVFVDHPKYYEKALNCKASVVLINKKVECPKGKALLISDEPFTDFNKLTQYFAPFTSANSAIAESAQIGKNTVIQPNVFIGNNVKIGENCLIHANVSINDNCIIGNNVIIHSGSVLGSDAFYYKKRQEGFERLLSSGRVVIEDNVDIGASCTIDRGVTGDTIIKEWAKLDNLIQVGHDTIIGRKCQIASHTGIAGCVIIEDEVILWGQVGIASAITIGEKAIVLAQSGVSKSLEGGKTYFGSPADEARTKMKELAMIRNIPSLLNKSKGK